MSLVKIPSTKSYWRKELEQTFVTELMTRDKWHEIKKFIHFNDNKKSSKIGSPTYDPIFKIRPIFEMIRKKFRLLPLHTIFSVDEQMIPFKGRSNIKQYVPSKPYKWGYKLFVLCSTDGVMYDMIPYTGKMELDEECKDLGVSSSVVWKLSNIIPKNENYVIAFDNWFTSLQLVMKLKQNGILSVGTVRSNRLQGLELKSDKDLKKCGRGTFQEAETSIEGITLRVTKWFDNKGVCLLSSFLSAEPVGTCQKYDRKTKEFKESPIPKIVRYYNENMGGVDKADQYISYYRIHIRSKKWYHRLFFHLIDMILVNSWLLYRKDAIKSGLPKKDQMNQFDFRLAIAHALAYMSKKRPMCDKRGRPATSPQTSKDKRAKRYVPLPEIKSDKVGHILTWADKRAMCKNPGCSNKTNYFCSK